MCACAHVRAGGGPDGGRSGAVSVSAVHRMRAQHGLGVTPPPAHAFALRAAAAHDTCHSSRCVRVLSALACWRLKWRPQEWRGAHPPRRVPLARMRSPVDAAASASSSRAACRSTRRSPSCAPRAACGRAWSRRSEQGSPHSHAATQPHAQVLGPSSRETWPAAGGVHSKDMLAYPSVDNCRPCRIAFRGSSWMCVFYCVGRAGAAFAILPSSFIPCLCTLLHPPAPLRFKPKSENSLSLRTHVQTSGYSLTAQVRRATAALLPRC